MNKEKKEVADYLMEDLIDVHERNLTASFWCENAEKAFVVHHCHDAKDEFDTDIHSKEYWESDFWSSGDIKSNITKEEAVEFIRKELGNKFIFNEI